MNFSEQELVTAFEACNTTIQLYAEHILKIYTDHVVSNVYSPVFASYYIQFHTHYALKKTKFITICTQHKIIVQLNKHTEHLDTRSEYLLTQNHFKINKLYLKTLAPTI